MQLKRHLGNNKGFTLIELLISLSIISIIVLTIFNLLHFSLISSNVSTYKDSILSNGRYGLEYMIREIERADMIIDSKKVKGFDSKYENSLKFVIYNYNREKSDNNHEFTSYFIKDNTLNRIRRSNNSGDYTNINFFLGPGGDNFLCESVKDVSKTKVNFEDKLINLSLLVGNDVFSYEFETILSINCLVDY